jgi:hypothetical protein
MLRYANVIRTIYAGLMIGDAASAVAATLPEQPAFGPQLRWRGVAALRGRGAAAGHLSPRSPISCVRSFRH